MAKELFLAKPKLFLHHGADLYQVVRGGYLPVHLAHKFGCLDIFEEGLKACGIDHAEFEKKRLAAQTAYNQQEQPKKAMLAKSGGGLSSTLALGDIVSSDANLGTSASGSTRSLAQRRPHRAHE